MTKTVEYHCDFCGRKIEASNIGNIRGNRGRSNYNHEFYFHSCDWCYPKVFNHIITILPEERKKEVREI